MLASPMSQHGLSITPRQPVALEPRVAAHLPLPSPMLPKTPLLSRVPLFVVERGNVDARSELPLHILGTSTSAHSVQRHLEQNTTGNDTKSLSICPSKDGSARLKGPEPSILTQAKHVVCSVGKLSPLNRILTATIPHLARNERSTERIT